MVIEFRDRIGSEKLGQWKGSSVPSIGHIVQLKDKRYSIARVEWITAEKVQCTVRSVGEES